MFVVFFHIPAETLRQFSAPVHRPEKGRVAITTETHQEFLAFLHAFQARHGVVATGDCVQNVMYQIGGQALVDQVFFKGLVVPI